MAQVEHRACEVMLVLLDRIAQDIAAGKLPSPHLAAYVELCRAESARRSGSETTSQPRP